MTKTKSKSEQLYQQTTQAFEQFILNRDSFQGRYVCSVTDKTYTLEEVKVGYLYNPLESPKIAFNEANAFIEYKGSDTGNNRLYSAKLNIAFKHGEKALLSLMKGNKNKSWFNARGIKTLKEINDKYGTLPTP